MTWGNDRFCIGPPLRGICGGGPGRLGRPYFGQNVTCRDESYALEDFRASQRLTTRNIAEW